MTDTMEPTKTYTFDQLSDRAKTKALDWWASVLDNDWAHYVIEEAKEQGKAKGFDIDDVRWSGFWSQGDGASWIGRVNLPKFIEACIPDTHPLHARAQVYAMLVNEGWVQHYTNVSLRSTFYVHSGGMSLDSIDDSALSFLLRNDYDVEAPTDFITHECPLKGANVKDLAEGIDAELLVGELEELVLEKAKEYADEIYARLEEAYEWETSADCFAEVAFANNYLFDEEGTLQ
jgi:hypothetical protein